MDIQHSPLLTVQRVDCTNAPEMKHIAETVLWDIYRISSDRALEKLAEYTQNEQCYRADMNGQVVGFVSLRACGDTNVELCKFAVNPDMRHKRVGTTLMSAVTSAMQDEGKATMELTALKSSVSFYRKNGFVEVSRYPDIRMRKPLF